MTETELFESLHIRLLRRTSDTRTIELWAKYRPDFAKLKIGEVVKDLPEVNESTFSRALAENGIKIGDRLIAHFFLSLEEKTARALRQSVSNSRQEEYQGVPWITFEVTPARTVRIIVSSGFRGCLPSPKKTNGSKKIQLGGKSPKPGTLSHVRSELPLTGIGVEVFVRIF